MTETVGGRLLRTNFRITGGQINADAIGRGMLNWQAQSNIDPKFFGGFIMGSFNSALLTNVVIISAKGAMSEYFGATFVSNVLDGQGSGYLVIPFVAWNASNSPTILEQFFPTISTSGSLAFIWPQRWTALSAGSLLQASAITISGDSVHMRWAGFIVSTP